MVAEMLGIVCILGESVRDKYRIYEHDGLLETHRKFCLIYRWGNWKSANLQVSWVQVTQNMVFWLQSTTSNRKSSCKKAGQSLV